MAWELLSVIGIIAFAVSGAIVAMEEEYDILGVYILGIVTAFGGGAIRNLLIGVPVSALWEQGAFFQIALASVTIVFLFPKLLLRHWSKWGNVSDAIGLSAFAIQGALYAVKMGHPLSAVVAAAVLTGSGGGIIRDLLAGRKPLVLKSEIYAVWAALGGLIVGLGWAGNATGLYVLFLVLVACRICSYVFRWRLPNRSYHIDQ
ncbi:MULTISPECIES: trimeric intracellular cation channel family protein [Bacillus amyloliquefaciens group]|uniref:trimeric intracellular cation channel family protein n=1 Tax=Bacillus amyloliquefaciens group TaxID=1938374 RepID=UPI00020594E0|nr:trimeric intracellular cation channel family protein [Bacillus amyloliquefaciens]AIW35194.1 membrane protein [Bacillus subtilis]AEB25544.1 integral inner membrane protein [Bacillus amyloliquefaciens TA208]AEK90577.1 putative integral inner membrane protein [Bacillus amyloliquefaciens XH7]MEC1831181.1 trimeric intracellular cation channel family protein [Bacillus amyloliquefaciens]MEC1834843.1 trimeric intracellular cation channel family protein [Bacillus amyloliquefaciens]